MVDLLKLAKKRLETFGVTVNETALTFAGGKVEEKIRGFCNLTEVPNGLSHAAVDLICGEYLYQMQQLGKLNEFDVDAAVKSIDEGDVKITFMDHASAADKLMALIGHLLDHDADLLAFRRLRW